ncbi:hypothetical protein ISN45_Aa01g018900 [Arabidopsis thaliana x Arabidopsis arenosa]|uniref:Uncharacterized protein n=1 Tax=Arabidopsis thaliana x Arabidopsis arenosa TaxID=1240361 RepID=A0A8T2C1F5_9BRAS|nr:hypothetical protein ISN45_Aa01g018900 [Arabidopsis thaliana x Arabidopsis arenosa]
MKVMKKGKVHPTHPLPPSFSSSNGDDSLSVFKLLPAAILVLVSVLSAEDREVLAYLITRSLNTTTVVLVSSKKKRSHDKVPLFDCGCFDCYTSYWSKWDSSSDRELINQIIETFEDHLTSDENSASHKSKKNKNRAKKIEISEEPIAKTTEPPVASDQFPRENSPGVVSGHSKGLARKVLPDVLGLLNSRFWSLWNLNA